MLQPTGVIYVTMLQRTIRSVVVFGSGAYL
jgi:hypothetical protein